MTEIKINIESCKECPFVSIEKVYTEDSWDDVSKYTCNKSRKTIAGYVDWGEKVKVPSWCEIKEN